MSKNLTQGSVFKNILVFSGPFLLTYFLQTLYGMADLFITGQFYGADVISAVAIGSQIMHMITVMIVGLAMGTTVLIGRAIGARNNDEASKITGNSISLFLIVSLCLTIILLLLCPLIVSAMSTPLESVEETKLYLYFCFSGIPFITAYNVISSIYRGLGDSKTPMIFVAIACVINILLDYLFMGLFGMKAEGAALATVLAQSISVVISLLSWKKFTSGLSIQKNYLRPDGMIFKGLLKIGLPVAAQDGFIQISFLLITVIANSRGVNVAAAVGIVEKIISFLFLVPSSMLSAISALAAQNNGAGEHGRARKTLAYGIALACGIGAVFAILFQFISEPVISLFTSENEVIVLGTQYLRSYVFDCIFAAVHFSFSGFFCAYGYSIVSFIHNVISIVFVRIPGAWLASKYYPDTLYPMGLAAPAGSALSALICLIFFVILLNKKKQPLS
ncbi:MAG: MATE family efflux transporter [Treponema sp.]|nr:MATE family efflux transporter [Treponema sp.]